MSTSEPSLSLPAAVKSGMRKDMDHQHPLVTACMRPKKNNIAQCDVCHIFFKQKKYLREHQIKEHGHKPQWQCSVCDLVLCSKYNLMCHMDKHKDLKRFKCPACTASFNTRASQRRHYMYKHTDERPHQCSLCDFAAVEHDKLLIHLRNHTGESPYKCETCGMTFKTPISYKRHVVTHAGWRQYLCHLCLKKYGSPTTVKEHIFRWHGVTKNFLDKVRNVKEHGMPSLLAKFLEGRQLNDSEMKMVNCLKYYEVLDSAVDDLEITNMDFRILKPETSDGRIVDKSPFFILKCKDPVTFIPTKAVKEEHNDPSWEEVEAQMEKPTDTRRKSGRKKIKTEVADTYDSDDVEMNVIEPVVCYEGQNVYSKSHIQSTEEKEDNKFSDNMKATSNALPNEKGMIENSRKRKRDIQSESKTESETQKKEMKHKYFEDCDESSKKAEKSDSIQERKEPEIKKARIEDETELGQNKGIEGKVLDVPSSNKVGEAVKNSSLDLANEGRCSAARTGKQGNTTARPTRDLEKNDKILLENYTKESVENVQGENNSSESDEDENETSGMSVFLQQSRQSLSLKTPKLNAHAKGTESNKTAIKPVSKTSSMVPSTSASLVSTSPDVESDSNKTEKVADSSNDIQGQGLGTVIEEEIPLPTSFVSVVADDTKEGTVTPVEDEESEASDESFDSSVLSLKGGPPKSLPPFISLERCSDEHKERLLTGMRKGVFGPTPSVIRVLEDGSMINVSNLYKTYLPPST